MTNKGFDEYGNYGENNPPVGDTESYTEAMSKPELKTLVTEYVHGKIEKHNEIKQAKE